MKKKVCFKCKQEKSVKDFYQYKSGENKGYYHSYCKECGKINLFLPWRKAYNRIRTRCTYSKGYVKKGIKCLIKPLQLKEIWFRDKAYLLKHPSIDRIDNDGNYEPANCRFIEMSENLKRRYGRG